MQKYDVIIIGGGIGGLVCGCLLSKAGKKVLILEKNNKAGGYCTSFSQKGFRFDLGPRFLSHCDESSYIRKILEELKLNLNLVKIEITECIVTPDYKINLYSNVAKTIEELQCFFPKEAKNIQQLFNIIGNLNKTSILATFYSQFKNKTFSYLLDKYIKNQMLKAILKIPLGNIALPSFKASAISAAMLYHGHIFKGGYYLEGGVGKLSGSLTTTFQKLGGKILLSSKVQKIEIKRSCIKKIILENDECFFARNIVCDCDPTYVLSNLIEKENIDNYYFSKFQKFIPSTSAFIVYLGLNKPLKANIERCCGLWYSTDYDSDSFYFNILKRKVNYDIKHLLFSFPSLYDRNSAPQNCDVITLITWVPYKDENFWAENSENLKEVLLNYAKNVVPNLFSLIQIEKIISPVFLYKYTLNREGSVRGWELFPTQLQIYQILQKIIKDQVYFVGQWATYYAPGGLFTSIFSAKKISEIILKK